MRIKIDFLCFTFMVYTYPVESARGPRREPDISYHLDALYYEGLTHIYIELPEEPFKVAVEGEWIIGVVLFATLYPFLVRENEEDIRYAIHKNTLNHVQIAGGSPLHRRFHEPYTIRKNIRWAMRLDIVNYGNNGNHGSSHSVGNDGHHGNPGNHGNHGQPCNPINPGNHQSPTHSFQDSC